MNYQGFVFGEELVLHPEDVGLKHAAQLLLVIVGTSGTCASQSGVGAADAARSPQFPVLDVHFLRGNFDSQARSGKPCSATADHRSDSAPALRCRGDSCTVPLVVAGK